MKQAVTQRKLIINNRKFSYFITLLKNNLPPKISLLRFLTLRGAISIYFSLHMRVNVSFISGLYCLDIGGVHCIGNEIMPTMIT